MSVADWMLLLSGAFLVGLAKGGVVGVGNLTIILFAMVFEPKASVGILLPVLISADVVAVVLYRRHAHWGHLRRILPWMVAGVLVGYVLFDLMSDRAIGLAIGWIVLLMTLLQAGRTLAKQSALGDFAERMPHSPWFSGSLGLLGGFATMVANAAGPIGQLYFISLRLPKLAFIGSGVWCFFLINLFKVPLQAQLGILDFASMQISLALMPAAVVGALLAPQIVKWIPERWFAFAVWFFIVVAAVKLIVG
jgi:uncharacterized membrane protein YfcA